jgi:hypothetical protein
MDIGTIQAAVGLAGAAITTTGQAASTVEAIKKLFTTGKPADDKGVELVNSLASQLTAVNVMNVELSNSLRSISDELRKEDDFSKQRGRYELVNTPEGDMVYRLIEELKNGQPTHYICPVCLNNDRLFNFIVGEGDYKVCQANVRHRFRFKNTPHDPYRVIARFNTRSL